MDNRHLADLKKKKEKISQSVDSFASKKAREKKKREEEGQTGG